MGKIALETIYLALYWYTVEQTGTIKKGKGRRIITLLLAVVFLGASFVWDVYRGMLLENNRAFYLTGRMQLAEGLAWGAVTILFLLFDLFFDDEPFCLQWWRIALVGAVLIIFSGIGVDCYVANGIFLWIIFRILAGKRGYLSWQNGLVLGSIYGALSGVVYLFEKGMIQLTEIASVGKNTESIFLFVLLVLEFLLLLLTEGTLFSYKKGFETQTEHFQQDMLSHQYEEIKNIYLNMRGWRHDYHNHLQVMKAQIALENYDELEIYLDELERDLDGVDTYVKSGNLMADAILNSKLTLAKERDIRINCKVKLPEQLAVADVDLCVILGNLLDNAIEACEQIEEDKRFLRIYMIVNKSQLYISIQNGAKEELNFNERNYITNKRGSHGFGMRRVKAMVDKYSGYLNLANEPGIFAAEVTMPLDIQ